MIHKNTKNILLAVTGGIAAYKSALFVRLCQQAGYVVRVVMTPSACQFITPLTFQGLNQHQVYCEECPSATQSGMLHIDLAKWADCIVVAPASANTIAKIAHGIADNLLLNIILAANVPVFLAPAMNQAMWSNPRTQSNIHTLQEDGVFVLGPDYGLQACGDVGPGRMLDPADLFQALDYLLAPSTALLAGKRIVITASRTVEAIDPVRYLSNHSSGKMGFSLAKAAIKLGASVTLISGPTHCQPPAGCEYISVTSAREMCREVLEAIPNTDMFIGAAAVAYYTVKEPAATKIKKSNLVKPPIIELIPTEDIISQVVQSGLVERVIGFSAETHDVLLHANNKLKRKRLDAIIANQVGEGQGFGQGEHEVTLLFGGGRSIVFPRMSKDKLAMQLLKQLFKAPVLQEG